MGILDVGWLRQVFFGHLSRVPTLELWMARNFVSHWQVDWRSCQDSKEGEKSGGLAVVRCPRAKERPWKLISFTFYLSCHGLPKKTVRTEFGVFIGSFVLQEFLPFSTYPRRVARKLAVTIRELFKPFQVKGKPKATSK